ncbi:MAG: ornithine cyclodeaminase family protein [Gemmataceae bacterium]
MNVLYLTEADVRSLLTMELAIPAVESAFRKLSLDEATCQPRQRCQTDHVMLHVLPAAAKTLGALGFKAYTTGKFGAKFHLNLYDPKTGDPTAIIEADYLGQVRTGAATGVATKKLSNPDARIVGILGAGKQSRTQLEAIGKVRTISEARVFSPTAERREAFAKEMTERCGFAVRAVETAEEAVQEASIVATATTAREPILKGAWLSEGCHVNLAGSNFLSKAEADSELFRRAAIVVADSKDQAKLEAGDFVAPMKAGIFGWSDVTDLCHILTGRYPGRTSHDDITIFKSLGLGIQDIAVGVKLIDLARQKNVGREVVF